MTLTKQVFEYVPAPPAGDDPLHGELLTLNMGPQHPATHGVLRLVVTLDGERIVECDPVVGYLHRGKEKSAESLGWHKFFPHTDRLDYVQPLMNNIGYALALEKLAGIEAPPRAQVIRVLLMELSRIMGHLIYLGTQSIDLGAVTIFFYAFKEREKLYEIVDAYTGHRMNNTYVRIGGVYADVDERVERLVEEFLVEFEKGLGDMDALLTRNRIWNDRNRGIGVISRADALAMSLTGPVLRGSGVEWDLRRTQPYCGYESYDFDVVAIAGGDFTLPDPSGLAASLGSAGADQPGGNNFRGLKSPVVDALIQAMGAAQTLPALRDAARALDRVVMWNHWQLPDLWTANERASYWNRFVQPKVRPLYFDIDTSLQAWPLTTWWTKEGAVR